MVAKKGPTVSEQLSEMKQAIDAQQQQIKQLSDRSDPEQKIQNWNSGSIRARLQPRKRRPKPTPPWRKPPSNSKR